MDSLVRTLVKLSRYVNKRNITIIMTYMYILTFLMLINTQVRLTKDYSLRENSLRTYLKRSLTKYNEDDADNRSKRDVTLNDSNDNQIFRKSYAGIRENIIPFGEVKTNIRDNAEKDNPGNNVNVKKQVNLIDKGKQHRENPDKEPSDHKVVRAVIKTEHKPNVERRVEKTESKYPNVEIVENFHFDNVLDVKEGMFQNISLDGTFLIFSAYRDILHGQPYVKALAINGNTFLPKFYCELTYDNKFILTTKGKIWMLPDHHEKDYKPVFLYCALPDDKVPKYVSIIPIKEPARLHKLPVIYHPKELRTFTVCLSPIFFNHSIEYELVQWFELNKLMGADFFIVYNHTTIGKTDEILNHYQKEGWIQVIQWQPPVYSDLHYLGQTAMMNDCLFRNYKASRYMVNIDLDELIIPRKGKNTWNELMPSLPQTFCEYSFRSTLVTSESKDVFEGKQKARELNLHFLLRMSRREYIFAKNVRSKYMINTTCIDTAGIHFCWKYRNGTADTQRYHVSPRDALTYHFRSEPVAKKGTEIEEKAVYKYHSQLIENAKLRWEKINSERKLAKDKKKIK